MKILVSSIFILIAIIFQGCIKDKITLQEAFLYNNTTCNIQILHYIGGVVSAKDTINLNPGDEYLYGNTSGMGDIKGPGFSTNHDIGIEDSIIVIFDNQYPVTHYVNITTPTAEKYHLFDSPRSVLNPKNYNFSRTEKKGQYTNTHRYYFTEADYDYAKE